MDSVSGTRSGEQGGGRQELLNVHLYMCVCVCSSQELGGRKCGEANQRAERAAACVCSWHGAGGRGDADFMHH